MAKNIGIDLGTTNSCISYLEGSAPVIIPNPEGSRVIPSMVALTRDNKRNFGNIAKRQFVTNNENTIWGFKRLMGRKYDSDEIRAIRQRVSYKILEAPNGDCKVQLGDKLYSPEEISAMLLGYLKSIAQDYLGEEIADTVITVPAFFNDAQRQATKIAGEIAGLKVTRIINEPTAALLAYKRKVQKDGLYAVYDLGGGTFDISIVEVKEDIYKVVSTTGDTFLGGNDFDEKIIEWILEEIKNDITIDVFGDKNTVQRIIQVAEKAKIELSFNQETQVSIPYLHRLPDGSNYHFQKKLTRTQLEHDTMHLIDKTLELIKKSLAQIKITPADVEKIILVGGQSRMPIVYEKIRRFFGTEPFIDLNPEEVVAQGAVLQAEVIKGKVKDILLLDVTSLSLGVETKGDRFTRIIDANSTIPIKKAMRFTTISDNQQTVTIHVLQGERIPLAPKGIPQIDVTFEIDANGIVRVSAREAQTGLVQSMKIQPASGLSPEEIQQRVLEAKQYEEQDKFRIKLNQVKLQLKEEMETVKFYYKNHVKKMAPKEKSEIKNLIAHSEKELEGEDLEGLESLVIKVQTQRDKINKLLISEFEK
jgi:molecular chaperone DnaK